ncbi:hypothetical protein [Deinococcus hopiensis]|uniref:Uncharacterized protein n=1 Tax=Deinococcus hopiensis KR-140 TaxID=695939 RepID=A0A1W1UYI3_9DEIO|nr:hypothetical protein [Deinococcus hopiensis]SMB85794.1 hypothetical protein SAMN00790413_03546 [Deinococcus hopiensis KR-140]
MITVKPGQVPDLIPDAPEPEQVHVNLAALWLARELTERRVTEGQLSPEQVEAARIALAAKALALKAGLGGVIALDTPAEQGVQQVKIGGLELKLATSTDERGQAVIAASDWDMHAETFLALALPAQIRPRFFPGVAR